MCALDLTLLTCGNPTLPYEQKELFLSMCLNILRGLKGLLLSSCSPKQQSHTYLLKCAKRIRHKLNKLMKSAPIYNKLQHYLIERACI
jgi:hypothetical protein